MNQIDPPLNRRNFVRDSLRGAGLLVAGAGLTKLARPNAFGAGQPNPFAYDLDRASKTDPKLIGYEQVARFASWSTDPYRVSLGSSEKIYVSGKNGVVVMDSKGTRLAEVATTSPARCAMTSPDGALFVGTRDHVEVYDADGRRKAAWGSPGKKVWFTGMTMSGDNLFVADAGNRVVLRYDLAGKLLGRIGEKNKEKNVPGLIVPSPYLHVAMGKDGLLRVNNPGRHCVETYTADGELELSWGRPSTAIEGFCGCCNPITVCLLTDGRCITCEKGLPRVKVYSSDGKFESVVAGTESFPENAKYGSVTPKADGMLGGLDAAVDEHGRVYVLDLVTAEVRVFKPKAA